MKICAEKDQEHLKLLAIFYYVLAVIAMLFSCLPIIHLVVGIVSLVSPEALTDASGEIPPPFFGWMFIIFGSLGILLGLAFSICLLCTGRFISKRKNRIFCLIVAGINCLWVPLGTALGVFTIIVFMRPSVKDIFSGTANLDIQA